MGPSGRWKEIRSEVGIPGTTESGSVVACKRRTGMRAFGRGKQRHASASLVLLPPTHPLWVAMNTHLLAACEAEIDGFSLSLSDKSAWPIDQTDREEGRWELSINARVEFAARDFVSVVLERWDYTGGFHGQHETRVLNAIATADGWREVELKEFFRAEVDWADCIAGHVSHALQTLRQAQSGDQEPEDTPEASAALVERAAFTFTSEGLCLWFDPSEVGSYAEGTYSPILPYQHFVYLLAPTGAARALPCF